MTESYSECGAKRGEPISFKEYERRALRRVIDSELTERQRELVSDYYFGGMNMRKIAEKYGITTSSVSRTLLRARKRIYRAMRFVPNRKQTSDIRNQI